MKESLEISTERETFTELILRNSSHKSKQNTRTKTPFRFQGIVPLTYSTFFFFFNRLCNPCGIWPDQLSLSILNRKVFTECLCQRHVKSQTWRTSDLERSNSRHKESSASETTQANPSSGRWNYGPEIAENFAESGDFHVTFG